MVVLLVIVAIVVADFSSGITSVTGKSLIRCDNSFKRRDISIPITLCANAGSESVVGNPRSREYMD